jgi:hypothetical protein
MVTNITAIRAIMDTVDIIVIMDIMCRTVVQAFKDTTEILENIIIYITYHQGHRGHQRHRRHQGHHEHWRTMNISVQMAIKDIMDFVTLQASLFITDSWHMIGRVRSWIGFRIESPEYFVFGPQKMLYM